MREASERVGPRPRQFYFLLALLLLLVPDGDQGFLLLALQGGGWWETRRGDEKLGEGRKWVKKLKRYTTNKHEGKERRKNEKRSGTTKEKYDTGIAFEFYDILPYSTIKTRCIPLSEIGAPSVRNPRQNTL